MEQDSNLSGKVCIVTGATSGIGEATALELARMNATVVVVSRDAKKCARVVSEIKEQTNNSSVDFLVADLSSQQDIRRIAEEFRSRYNRLDILVNNAGAIFFYRAKSADGIEMTFALNHLAYFLLTNLLLDMLIASAPARIINVTSAKHTNAVMNFEDLEFRKGYNGQKAYDQSKLANLLFNYELARRLEGRGVTVNAIHPGFVETNLGKSNAGIFKPLFSLFRIGGITPQEGARPIIFLASSDEVAGVTGSYFFKEKAAPSLAAYYEESARLLWEVSADKVGLKEPLADEIVEH